MKPCNHLNKQTNKHVTSLVEALKKLTPREIDVLEKVAKGKTNKEIANELFLSVRTVENTRARICRKLGLNGRGSLKEWLTNYYKKNRE
jgi:DNA-binding NarL/FixJ family response regulator